MGVCGRVHTHTSMHTQSRHAHAHKLALSVSPPRRQSLHPHFTDQAARGALCSHHVAPLGTWRAVRVLFSAGCSGLPWRGLQGLVPRSLAEWGASQPPEPPAFLLLSGLHFVLTYPTQEGDKESWKQDGNFMIASAYPLERSIQVH